MNEIGLPLNLSRPTRHTITSMHIQFILFMDRHRSSCYRSHLGPTPQMREGVGVNGKLEQQANESACAEHVQGQSV